MSKIYKQFCLIFFLLTITGVSKIVGKSVKDVSLENSVVWGPGLKADFLVPVRYIYVQLVDKKGAK